MTAKTKEIFCKDKLFLRYMQIFERILRVIFGVLFTSEEATRRLSVDTDTNLEFWLGLTQLLSYSITQFLLGPYTWNLVTN